MKSIVDTALSRHEKRKKHEEVLTQKAPEVAPEELELEEMVKSLHVSIKILGCGGGGSNTINRLNEAGVMGAQLLALNTDAKHLLSIHSPTKMLIGKRLTKGLGAGAIPEVGEQATQENEDEIKAFLRGAHITFITAGMGGGTGTGGAHFIAGLARQEGSLTLGVVTMPFQAEGKQRMEVAKRGLERLRRICDTTVVIYNDKLLELVPRIPIDAAFKVADEVLMESIKGMTEIITKPGLVNLDYSDLTTIMKNGGVAMIGIGGSDEGRDRVTLAVNEALESPLLGEVDLSHARGALVRIIGSPEMTVSEAESAARLISERVNPKAQMIWGCSIDPSLEKRVRVLVVITGVESEQILGREGPQLVEEHDIDIVQ